MEWDKSPEVAAVIFLCSLWHFLDSKGLILGFGWFSFPSCIHFISVPLLFQRKRAEPCSQHGGAAVPGQPLSLGAGCGCTFAPAVLHIDHKRGEIGIKLILPSDGAVRVSVCAWFGCPPRSRLRPAPAPLSAPAPGHVVRAPPWCRRREAAVGGVT